MSIYYQKQPVFTATPILKVQTFNPTLADRNWDPTNNQNPSPVPPTVIFDGNILSVAQSGLIERITVVNAMDLSTGVNWLSTEKLVWLYIYDGSTWNLYKAGHMPAADLSVAGTVNPQIEWTFTGGLAVNNTIRLGILASANFSTNSYYGDYLSVTVEGGDYSAVL
jgi:hypothetical protein